MNSSHYLWFWLNIIKMFHWILISFGRKFCNLFLDQFGFRDCFDTCFVFDLICLFWVNSIYLLCCYVVSEGSSSQLVLILTLIFGWTLSVQDVSLISFGRKFCNLFLDQFGFQDCFWYMFCFWLDLPVLGQ